MLLALEKRLDIEVLAISRSGVAVAEAKDCASSEWGTSFNHLRLSWEAILTMGANNIDERSAM
jgi:hypothetical protein